MSVVITVVWLLTRPCACAADVKTKLCEVTDAERAAFILMQRIFPAEQEVVFVRDGKHVVGPGVNEFGVYGVLLCDGEKVIQNAPVGHLIRTKVSGTQLCTRVVWYTTHIIFILFCSCVVFMS